jgi:molybdopterin/thiamine biosynthesis adenylyltransferase
MSIPGSVLLIGAGGIGCGAALGLGAAGIERLVVVDDDRVDETNLHRQVLHQQEAVGLSKVESLALALRTRFPQVTVEPIDGRFDIESAARLAALCDVLIDGSDNLATKFLANDAAVLARRPLVHGAAVETWGQLLTIAAGGQPCYRCLFEELPEADAAPSCAEAGVLGPVPGVIGALQATEAVRLLLGKTPLFSGRLIKYDSPSMAFRTVTFRRNPECKVCGEHPSITAECRS